MHISIVIGTARKGRQSEKVGKLLDQAFANRKGTTSELVDVRDHVALPVTIPSWGEGGTDAVPTHWKEIVAQTDAFVFILPEYNHGYPGEWKLLIDSLSEEYVGKRVYIVGVSKGVFSGVRVADHVKPILVELGFRVEKVALYIGNVTKVLNDHGEPADEALAKRVQRFVDSVAQGE